MNRYAQVLTASALAYTAQASAAAKWARGTTMSSPPQFIATAEQLVALTKEPRARHLVVCGNLANVPSFRLAPGQTLTGNGDNASISFAKDVDGLQLSSDNEVRNLRLEASAGRRAIFNDTSVARLGTIRLRLTVQGVGIPDSKLAREITELVRDTASPLLFHHSSRVYYFGALAA